MPDRSRPKQEKTWRFGTKETPDREAYLLIQHLAGMQIQELAVLLRPYGITPEQYHVLRVLEAVNWNKKEAARVLEIGRGTLYRKIEEYGLEPGAVSRNGTALDRQ